MTREEAIQILRTQYPHDAVIKEALGLLIPELRESDDERIRKWLYDYFNNVGKAWIHSEFTCEQILAWLEKQESAFENGRQLGIMQEQARQELEWTDEKQKEQKPAEWSEEDEAMLDSVIRIITRFDDLAHEPTFAGPKWTHPYTKEIAWLKSLRPRPSWKPSEELLDALYIVAYLPELEYYGGLKDKIRELYKQLKKL